MHAAPAIVSPATVHVCARRPFFRAFVRALSRLRPAEPVPDGA